MRDRQRTILGRRRKRACLSHISVKGNSYGLRQGYGRGFFISLIASRIANRGPIRETKEGQKKMRRDLMCCLRVILMVCVIAFSAELAFGENINIGDYSYSYSLSTKEGTITKYNGSDENIIIPSTFSVPETYRDSDGETHTRHHTITVTAIGSSAYANNTSIKTVIFHDKLTSIGSSAFKGCIGLESIKTSASLRSLGYSAFRDCTALEDAEIDGDSLDLYWCTSIFTGCKSLKRLKIGDGVVGLECNNGDPRMLQGCNTLREVSVGRGVTRVPEYFLSKCGSVNNLSVSFSGSLVSIESSAFNNNKITNLNVALANCKVGVSAFAGCTANLNELDFTQVVSIGSSAFANCTNLVGNLDLPAVTSIGSSAFKGCIGLESIRTSASLRSLGYSAFRDCTALEDAEIDGDGLDLYWCTSIFTGCKNLKRLKIGDGVVGLECNNGDPRMLQGCNNLQAILFKGAPPSTYRNSFSYVDSGTIGTYTAEHAAAWEAVIDSKGYWNGLKMKPSYYTVIYDANNGTGARTTATVEWGEPTPAGDGAFTWEAHYFMGWAFEDVGGSTLGSNDVIPEPQEGNTVTLYGQWATFEPVAADWSTGSITLKATNVAAKEGELVWLSYCDASGENTNWQHVENSYPTSNDGGQSISVMDSDFSSRLGGISAVTYRFQIGTSLDNIRATMNCTTRTKRGIFVGVGEFGNDYQIKPKPLPSAPVDAEKFCNLMDDQGKMADRRLLTNGNATYEKVGRAFSDFADMVKPGDVCIVYFSTHGGVVPYVNIGDTTIGSLCLYDKPPETDDPHGVGYHEALLANHIRMLDPENKGVAVVNIISACHSGAFFDDSNQEMCSPASSWCHKENLSAVNVAWITAASYKATSYSYFDKFLINYGWDEGWADINNAKVVSFLDLANYTKQQYDDLFSGIVFEDETESKQAQIVNGTLLGKIIAGSCVAHGTKDPPSQPLNVLGDKGKSRDNIMIRWDNSSDAREYCIFYRFGAENSDGEENPHIGIRNTSAPSCDFKVTRENQHDQDEYEDFLATTQTWPALFIVKAINGKGISKASTESEGWVNALLRKVVFNGNGGAIPNSWDGTPIGGFQYQVSIWVSQGEKLWMVPTADKVGFTLCGWFNGNQVATPETVIQDDVIYTARWTDMTADYLSSHPTIATASCGKIATAANMTAANGCRTVGECYALGIDPEDPNDDLKIADFKIEDGKPVITLNHTKDGSGNSFEPRIKTLGKQSLTDAEWIDITDKDQSAYRFFKVTVDLP